MYVLQNYPKTFEDVYQELLNIQAAFLESNFTFLLLQPLSNEPAKPRQGMMVIADGVNWNPGDGEGFYFYTSRGSWSKISGLLPQAETVPKASLKLTSFSPTISQI